MGGSSITREWKELDPEEKSGQTSAILVVCEKPKELTDLEHMVDEFHSLEPATEKQEPKCF